MKKLTLLVLLLPFFTVFAQDFDMKANFSNSVGYNITEKGYIALPKQTAKGIIATNNRYSEIYLVKDKSLKTLVATRGCGSFTNLNKEKTLLGFKSIDENGNQAPAILNLMTEEVLLLEDYSNQCGQVSFSNDGTIAYTVGNNLIINRNGVKKSYDLGYYTNIANLSPDGKSIAFSDPDGHPILMDLTTGSKTKMSDIGDLYNPKWSPDGQKIVVEQGNATLYVIEPAQKKVLKLDKGFEASWTADSKELVYSRSDYENDDVFFFKGISVHQASFDGKMRRVIIPTSKECPQEVALLDNGKLAVSYSYGNRRLVAVSLSDTKSSIEEELFTLPAQNVHFGKVPKNLKNNNVTLRPSTKSTPQTKVGSIGKDDIPYINQVYDVPASYAGCTGYGYVACAPSTSCMLLGYYKLVPPKAVSSRHGGWGSTIYYSWYVGQQYTSSTNYTFSLAASGNGCYAKGGYGYMWNGGSPSSKMRGFYQNNGVTSAAYDYSGYSKIKSECAANYPYSWCITSSRSNGHLILPFRADARCVKVNNVWTILDDRTGSVVVHDPYGDANASTWLGDGRYSTYDCPGYNNGYIRMSNAWGVVVRYTKPTTTSIKTSVSSLAYGGVTVGSTSQKTFKVTLEGLSSATVTSSNNSIFAVSPTSVSNGTTVTVTFKPTAAQSYSGTITVANGSHKATVSCSGSGINPPLTFTQVWNYSERSTAGTPAWASDKTKIRNMDFGGGKLYVVNPVDGVIHVINSQTGAKLKDLDMTGVEGGALKIIDCKYVGGKIIACNIAASGSPLKVYVWDNDNAQPRVFLNTTSYGGMDRIGDCLSIEGNLTNGKIYFAAGGTTTANKVVMYTITNGVCSTTPTITELNEAGDKIVLGLSPRVRPSGTGKYWVMGQNYYPTLCSGEGTAIIPLNPDALLNDCAGNDFKAFTFKGTQYGIATTYQPGATAQERLTLGRVCLVDATSGWADADKIGEYPSGGMGTTRNTSFSTSVAVAVNGTSGVEMWVLIHNQGIAYFKHGTVPTYSFDPPAPTINVASSSSFEAIINALQMKPLSVTASNLTADISLALSGTNANLFALSSNTIPKTGGSVNITYRPTTLGIHTATLTLTSPGATTKTVNLTGTGKQEMTLDDNVNLTQQWNFSQISGNTANWITNGSQVTQDIAYNNGKLYVLERNADNVGKIHIVNAYTGAKTGELNTAACTEGTYSLSAIDVLGGKVVACNLAAGGTSNLIVYKWDSDTSEPVKMLETTTHADVRAGDKMGVSGTMTSGKIWFGFDSKVYNFTVTNGVAATTPTVINLMKSGTAFATGQSAAVGIEVNSDGSFWVIGKDAYPARFSSTGEWIENFATAAVGGPVHGTAANFFDFGTKKYAAVATYLNKSQSSLGEGCFSLINVTSGIAAEQPVELYPANGLGGTRNTSFRSQICSAIENDVGTHFGYICQFKAVCLLQSTMEKTP